MAATTAAQGSMLPHRHEGLDEYLVKETFVPTHGHGHTNATHSHGSKTRVVRRKKQRDESPFSILCSKIVEHQLGFSINLLLLLALTHICVPRARAHTRKFFEMTYYNAEDGAYTRGVDDGYFVLFWIVIFTGLRIAIMEYLLRPIARYGGILTKKGQVRFMEQGWQFIYYSAAWTVGLYIMYHSDYWFNLRAMWIGFPTRSMSGLMKWYYLVQFALWLQQLFVVNIEAWRKDHYQMCTHHIFTAALLFFSYGFYQTKVGNVILCIMDICDVLLAFAKMLNYLGFTTACDVAFGVFISSWFVTRHIFYNLVCYSIYAHVPSAEFPYGCFDSATGQQIDSNTSATLPLRDVIFKNTMQPFEDPEGPICFNNRIRVSFLGLLLGLQVLTLIWFGMILRVAYRVLSGKGAEDSRSEDEGEDEEEEVEIEVYDTPSHSGPQQKFIVEDADGASVNLLKKEKSKAGNGAAAVPRSIDSPSSGRNVRRNNVTASGISIPGHGDKKELLGRIGCDKPS